MFHKAIVRAFLLVGTLLMANEAMADTFGTGANQFTIAFVPISGATNPTSGYGIVNYDYRIGTYEITNDQWNKFAADLAVPVRDVSSFFTGANVPTGNVSWYAVAQFVNWLNTSTNHQAAYKFTGTQGTDDYTFAPWSTTDAGYDASNPYRNKDAFYFLPTEDEWVKAAYWNGTTLQHYATKDGSIPTQGNGTSSTGWNYYNGGYATNPAGPWTVGSGSEELNGTYDMMGNDSEWVESPHTSGDYAAGSKRCIRGGNYKNPLFAMDVDNNRSNPFYPTDSYMYDVGFRVASAAATPEPSTLVLLGIGAVSLLAYGWKRRRAA
jgi:formylglycine-generating enzyme required for sulfatase activity